MYPPGIVTRIEAAARRGAEDALADLRVVTTIEQA